MAELTPKQQRFVEEYLADLNATQAAIRAGYSQKTANKVGPRLLVKVGIAAEIEKGQKARSNRTQVTIDQVVTELARIGFADMGTYLRLDADGYAYLDWSKLPEGATRVISEIIQEEYVEGRGEGAREVKRTKFKLHDKIRALNILAQHLGMLSGGRAGASVRMPDGTEVKIGGEW